MGNKRGEAAQAVYKREREGAAASAEGHLQGDEDEGWSICQTVLLF